MATYPINTTAKHDAALVNILAKVNADRAAEDPPKQPVTAAQYVQNRVKDMLDSYVTQDDEEQSAPIRDLLKNASPAQRAAARAALGG